MIDTSLIIAGKTYQSRLLVGSGKYQDLNETKLATEAAEADIITVAIRRTNIGQDKNNPLNLLAKQTQNKGAAILLFIPQNTSERVIRARG
jgi:thiazole synthase